MNEHDVVVLNADFAFHTKGTDKNGSFEVRGIIPKGTEGTIVSSIKGDGCWVEFPSIRDNKTPHEDGVHWVETSYLKGI